MAGMDVPIKVILNTETKSFEIEIGTPPTTALIKQELGLKKGSGKAGSEMVADIPIDNIIKIAKVKIDGLLANEMVGAVKEVIGTCVSVGVKIEGMLPRDAQKAIDEGKWNDKITGKAQLEEHSAEELAAKQAELQKEIEAKHQSEEAEAEKEKAAEEAAKPAEEAKPEEKKEGEVKPAEGKPAEGAEKKGEAPKKDEKKK